jgi:Mce-associated membrane protein
MTTLRDDSETAVDVGAEATAEAEIVVAQHESDAAETEPAPDDERETRRRPIRWSRVLAYGVLPAIALLLALAAGYFKWAAGSAGDVDRARAEAVRVAGEDAVVLLSYKADSVDKDLAAARERLTGDFKDAYTELTRQVVVPGAKEKHISASARVNAAAPVSATANHAVVLLFVDQTVTVGDGAPTDTQPVVRVTLDKVNGRWMVSRFDPV